MALRHSDECRSVAKTMHILRIANFVSPTSGGIKTALRHWGQTYREHGHQVSLIIPGPGDTVSEEDQGRVYRVPAMPIPRTGYSLMWSRRGLGRLIEAIGPDVVEISDRSTLRWLGPWCGQRGIGSVMISHENMTGIMQRRTPAPDAIASRTADFINNRSAADHDAIVCPSDYAAQEFVRNGHPATVVPLGVDLDTFVPTQQREDLTPAGYRRTGDVTHLIHCGRLSPEKNPWMSIETVRELVRRGERVHLTVLGHGPLRAELLEETSDLPVTFHAYITSRRELANVMSRADVAIAPGPVETFGLAALEALAAGVPTVCPDQGALQEVVGDGGVAAPSRPEDFADAVQRLLKIPDARQRARSQAEQFTWEASGKRMLDVHHRVAATVELT